MASPADNNTWQNERSFEKTNWQMLENEQLCDVMFEVGRTKGEPINAHKFILASRSPVFYAMFCGTLREQTNTISIPDIEPLIFRQLLRYVYTEECDINEETVMPLIYSSKKYGCQRLTEKCVEYLNDQISVDNVCVILQHAHVLDERKMEDKCLKLVFENAESVLESEGLLSVSREVLQKIIESDELYAEEIIVYNACKKWAVHQCKEKLGKHDCSLTEARDQLGDLMYHIRFPTMPLETFARQVSIDELLTPEEKVSIFQSILDVSKMKQKYSKKRRMFVKSQHKIFRRFEDVTRAWTCGGCLDVINFNVSAEARLVGICLYTPASEGRIVGQTRLQCGTCILASKDNLLIEFGPTKVSEEVLFERPVRVEVGKEYSVYAKLSGSSTYYGSKGKTSVSSGNLTVSFSNNEVSKNGTNVAAGQIQSLIFVT